MAQFAFDIPDDLFSGLDGIFDEVAPKMIDEAMPIFEEAVQKSAKESISTLPEDKARQTGEMLQSIKHFDARKTKTGAYISSITFNGTDEKGVRNMVKAAELEYGNSHQTAKPFLQRADNACRTEVLKKMKEVYDREVGS